VISSLIADLFRRYLGLSSHSQAQLIYPAHLDQDPAAPCGYMHKISKEVTEHNKVQNLLHSV